MKKLLIFDLDGTLIDTLEDLKNAVNHALKTYNYPLRTKEEIRQRIGKGVANLVARSMPEGEENPDYPATLKEFRKYYAIHSSDNTEPYKGVYTTCLELKRRGYLLAVATNKLTDIARPLIEKFYPNVFDYIQGDEPGMDRKPAPMMVNSLCKRFNVDKSEAFYIGDTNIDMQTAENSEVDYVLVTYGYRTKEELKEMCPGKPMIDHIEDLLVYIKK